MKRHLCRASAVLVLALAGCGGGESAPSDGAAGTSRAGEQPASTTAVADDVVTVELAEQNESGQRGTARLNPLEDGFEVRIEVSPPKAFAGATQHAHIHDVTCAEYARVNGFDAQLATVVDSLSDLSDNTATTAVGVPLSERTTGSYSINVHEQNHPYTAVACGDIPRD